jgi:hypothetical protein
MCGKSVIPFENLFQSGQEERSVAAMKPLRGDDTLAATRLEFRGPTIHPQEIRDDREDADRRHDIDPDDIIDQGIGRVEQIWE